MVDEDVEEGARDLLELNDDGDLVDEKGKVINEFGATRFDVAVRAIRGEFDPSPDVDNTEDNTGIILGSLIQFPCDYDFQVVGKMEAGDQPAFARDIVDAISKTLGLEEPIPPENITLKKRGTSYLSIKVTARVQAPEKVQEVFDVIEKDDRVVMKF